MEYASTYPAVFVSRPNRFTAIVTVDGQPRTVHVKNTGRCRELLLPGAAVILQAAANPNRKTPADLIAVYKPGLGWVNIDSQAPNAVAAEWLGTLGFDRVMPEYRYGASRLDFCAVKDGRKTLIEVKGCTLEREGIGYFPDAPTERGARHLRELKAAVGEGHAAWLLFVIQMEGVTEVRPNTETDPAFAAAWKEAAEAGVEVKMLPCRVTENTLTAAPYRKTTDRD